MTVASNSSLVQTEIGGKAVPLKRSPRCRTCRSDARYDVDMALAQGRPYGEIVGRFPKAGLTVRNVAEHFRRHVPVHSPQVRRVVAEQAAQNGEIMQAAVDHQVGLVKLAREVVENVSTRIAAGEMQPSFKDGVAAARLLATYEPILLERDELRLEVKQCHQDFASLLGLVRGFVDDAQWSALGRVVAEDPRLRAFWPSPESDRGTTRNRPDGAGVS
jgi:hypothetical protein